MRSNIQMNVKICVINILLVVPSEDFVKIIRLFCLTKCWRNVK